MERKRAILPLALAGLAALVVLVAGGRALVDPAGPSAPADTVRLVETVEVTPATDGVVGEPPDTAVATFAGGCFWCMEGPFDRLEGVLATVSGFTGGHVDAPSYDEVVRGGTGHREAVRITYDPARVSYTRLLQVFWHNVDPTDAGGQFCDRGHSYTTAIWAHNAEQRRLAEASLERLKASGALGDPVVTPVLEAGPFYPAEAYHQDFYRKNPDHYEAYRTACGRDRVLRQLWGDAAGH